VPDDASEVFRAFVDAVGLHGQAAATAAGLPATDWYALSLLDLAGGSLPMGPLAERAGLTTGAATRMVDRLERAGRVRRLVDPGDRRRVLVERVAEAGDAEVDALVGPARREVGAVLAGFDAAEQAVLYAFFARAAPAFRRATEEIRGVTARERRRG